MIAFWMMTGLAAALAALLVLAGARRGAEPSGGPNAADPQAADPQVEAGSREMQELDRLKARGLLDDDAYAGARAEAGRRLLAMTAAPAPVTGGADRLWVLGAVAVTVAAALGNLWIARAAYFKAKETPNDKPNPGHAGHPEKVEVLPWTG